MSNDTSHVPTNPSHIAVFAAPRDILFYVLWGCNIPIISALCQQSADRMCIECASDTPRKLLPLISHSDVYAQNIFLHFLYKDAKLREQVLHGQVGTLKAQPLCPYKAEVLFRNMGPRVFEQWINNECTTPLQLVQSFEEEYLAS